MHLGDKQSGALGEIQLGFGLGELGCVGNSGCRLGSGAEAAGGQAVEGLDEGFAP